MENGRIWEIELYRCRESEIPNSSFLIPHSLFPWQDNSLLTRDPRLLIPDSRLQTPDFHGSTLPGLP
jgi:hypothetical protein